MRVLVTAGNTQTPIDEVRVITNVFTGRTGTQIAVKAHERGHSVTLLTSHPELVADHEMGVSANWHVHPYRTYDDLHSLMARLISSEVYDVIIHCAAVSDYQLAGVFVPAETTRFDAHKLTWESHSADSGSSDGGSSTMRPTLVDVAAGKIKSHHSELWMRMVPTPKLIDQIRNPWGFRGTLVKFKLEVGVDDAELVSVAEGSRVHSQADLMVANTDAGRHAYALLGPINGEYKRVERTELADRLLSILGDLTRSGDRSLRTE